MVEDERGYGEALGMRISTARGKLTQVQLAESIGISKNTMLRYEKGTSVPDMVIARKICSITGVNLEWLTYGRGPMRGRGSGVAGPLRKESAQETAIENSFIDLGMVEGMALLTEIYSSGDAIYIKAINANLQAFSDAVKSKAKSAQMEAALQDMQTQMNDMREEIHRMRDIIISMGEQNDELKRQVESSGGQDPLSMTG